MYFWNLLLEKKAIPPDCRPVEFDLFDKDVKLLYSGNSIWERFQISERATKSQLFMLSKKSLLSNLSPNILLDRPFIFHALKDIKEDLISKVPLS